MTLTERRNTLLLKIAALAQRHTAPLTELNALETSERLDEIAEELEAISTELQDLSVDYWKSYRDDG